MRFEDATDATDGPGSMIALQCHDLCEDGEK